MPYIARTPPADPAALSRWLAEELQRIAQESVNVAEVLRLSETNVAPAKPRAGDIRYADGTNWNPGAGAGFYGYSGSAWSKF